MKPWSRRRENSRVSGDYISIALSEGSQLLEDIQLNIKSDAQCWYRDVYTERRGIQSKWQWEIIVCACSKDNVCVG